ncbi:hypothetical protein IscW_ISCW009019 [Ixodes scapularis]|uniref:Uncharacterized protein n=1 Tax=Ixodes scapularis TaxID=6945 RepID=B7Q2J9_IXOSC|nr:hypothetical protein IscW_ISCW009019 [Ixodes scapularis]|eukprot:XP_002410856.1 hypothetical protein IscW_ISCW009019 [Ixodes scapularis]
MSGSGKGATQRVSVWLLRELMLMDADELVVTLLECDRSAAADSRPELRLSVLGVSGTCGVGIACHKKWPKTLALFEKHYTKRMPLSQF